MDQEKRKIEARLSRLEMKRIKLDKKIVEQNARLEKIRKSAEMGETGLANVGEDHSNIVVKEEVDMSTDMNSFYAVDDLGNQDSINGHQGANGVVSNEDVSDNDSSGSVNTLIDANQKRSRFDDKYSTALLNQADQIRQLQDRIQCLEDANFEKDVENRGLKNRMVLIEEFMARRLLMETKNAGVDLRTDSPYQIQTSGQSSVSCTHNQPLDNVADHEPPRSIQNEIQISGRSQADVDSGNHAESDVSSQNQIIADYNDLEILEPILPYLSEQDILGTKSLLFDRSKSFPETVKGREDFHHFEKNVQLVLEKYGDQILNLQICGYSGQQSVIEFYRRLVLWLTKLPNLRFLHFVGYGGAYWNLHDLHVAHPLPSLPKLESLTLEGNAKNTNLKIFESNTDGSIFGALMSSYMNDQLQRLVFSAECWTIWVRNKWHKDSLSGLVELRITGDWTWGGGLDILDCCGARLQGLVIGYGDLPQANQNALLQKLNGLEIQFLDITPSVIRRSKIGIALSYSSWLGIPVDWSSWNMPMLRHLRMPHTAEPGRYKFLGMMPALQTLEILINLNYHGAPILGHSQDEISSQVVRWVDRVPNTDTTLIWKLIPSLQVIKICISFRDSKVYHRKDYT